jgi:hypothetical protein
MRFGTERDDLATIMTLIVTISLGYLKSMMRNRLVDGVLIVVRRPLRLPLTH